jgi:hypothetical protein
LSFSTTKVCFSCLWGFCGWLKHTKLGKRVLVFPLYVDNLFLKVRDWSFNEGEYLACSEREFPDQIFNQIRDGRANTLITKASTLQLNELLLHHRWVLSSGAE